MTAGIRCDECGRVVDGVVGLVDHIAPAARNQRAQRCRRMNLNDPQPVSATAAPAPRQVPTATEGER